MNHKPKLPSHLLFLLLTVLTFICCDKSNSTETESSVNNPLAEQLLTVEENIMDWQYSQEFARMLELVDPYSYLDSLIMPKFMINAASDEFFLPDSWKFYWDDLPGSKYIRYVPNTGHNLSETDAGESLISFYNYMIQDIPLPEFNWSVNGNKIMFTIDPENSPSEINLWRAANPDGRDFRLYVIDRTWTSSPVALNETGKYELTLTIPEEGYAAYFVEATYQNNGIPIKFTSGTVVLPDTYPYPAFEPESPLGTIDP